MLSWQQARQDQREDTALSSANLHLWNQPVLALSKATQAALKAALTLNNNIFHGYFLLFPVEEGDY